MANTDLHAKPMNEVQMKENEKYYFTRAVTTERTFPSTGVELPTTGQTYPLGIPERH